jgi:hypothetical protein
MEVQFADDAKASANMIQWSWMEEGHQWMWEFPKLTDSRE